MSWASAVGKQRAESRALAEDAASRGLKRPDWEILFFVRAEPLHGAFQPALALVPKKARGDFKIKGRPFCSPNFICVPVPNPLNEPELG